jgi:hypothetical protein
MAHLDDALHSYTVSLKSCKICDIPVIIDAMNDFIDDHGVHLNPNFLQAAWLLMSCAQEHHDRNGFLPQYNE